jgi:hypothetical protein
MYELKIPNRSWSTPPNNNLSLWAACSLLKNSREGGTMENKTRREFLKVSGLILGGLIVAPMATLADTTHTPTTPGGQGIQGNIGTPGYYGVAYGFYGNAYGYATGYYQGMYY